LYLPKNIRVVERYTINVAYSFILQKYIHQIEMKVEIGFTSPSKQLTLVLEDSLTDNFRFRKILCILWNVYC